MKKLILSAFLGISLASATDLNIATAVGTGYLDSSYKAIIFKFEKNIRFFNVGGKFANSYLRGYISTIPSFAFENKIVGEVRAGVEKYKIENKNEIQTFINYKALLVTNTPHFNPSFTFEIGTKSLKANAGVLYHFLNNKFTLEYEIGKRFLYKTVENKKNTTNTAIYIKYFF